MPVWLWPNLLSLDAPLLAILWQDFLSYRFSLPRVPPARLALGLTVWAIYLLDRLLDAREPPLPLEPARHRYFRRHWTLMAALLSMVLTADAVTAILWLRPSTFRDGFILLGGVGIYLVTFHLYRLPVKVPKEIAAATVFTAGIFLTARAALGCLSLAWPAIAFFVLCLANMIAIEAWERREIPQGSYSEPHPWTRGLARTYSFWVPVAVIVCALAGRNAWYASIALSAAACAVLFWSGRRLSLEVRRVMVDGVLLSPLLFLPLRAVLRR